MLVEQQCMGIACVYKQLAALAIGMPLLLSVGGCATSTAGTPLMDARAEAPARRTSAYPQVDDLPPNREMPAMTLDERSKLKNELIAARDRQAAAAKAQGGSPPDEPVKP
jgi:hypothetical protein